MIKKTMTGNRLYNNVMGWEFADNKPSLWHHPQPLRWLRMIRTAKRSERREAKITIKKIIDEIEPWER